MFQTVYFSIFSHIHIIVNAINIAIVNIIKYQNQLY